MRSSGERRISGMCASVSCLESRGKQSLEDKDQEQGDHNREIEPSHRRDDLTNRAYDRFGNFVQEPTDSCSKAWIKPGHDGPGKENKHIDVEDREQYFRNAQKEPAFVERVLGKGQRSCRLVIDADNEEASRRVHITVALSVFYNGYC